MHITSEMMFLIQQSGTRKLLSSPALQELERGNCWENTREVCKTLYASAVWSPNTVKHCSLIENIQRRATKFILNYSKDMSYTERLIATNLLPLEFRREISDLLLVFKAKTGLIPMDINNYLCTYEPGYKSRNYDENNFNFLTKH